MSGDDHGQSERREDAGRCDNTTHVCSCAWWSRGAVAHDDDCNIWLNDWARGGVSS